MIEPEWGYVISEPWSLQYDSMAVFLAGQQHPAWRLATPSALDWADVRGGGDAERVVEFDEVVSLRFLYEWNYFHFHFDVLSKLALLERLGPLPDVPYVVGPYFEHKAFARDMFELGTFAERDVFVQPLDTYVRANTITYCRPRMTQVERATYVTEQLREEPLLGARGPDRKVLLTRRPPTQRCLANAAEVEEALEAIGFEVIDAADMPAVEQVRVFRETRLLVAIHGAGEMNILHRAGQPMDLVELCAEVFWSEDFREMSADLGFGFRRLLCPIKPGGNPEAADLYVDVDELLTHHRRAHGSPGRAPRRRVSSAPHRATRRPRRRRRSRRRRRHPAG